MHKFHTTHMHNNHYVLQCFKNRNPSDSKMITTSKRRTRTTFGLEKEIRNSIDSPIATTNDSRNKVIDRLFTKETTTSPWIEGCSR